MRREKKRKKGGECMTGKEFQDLLLLSDQEVRPDLVCVCICVIDMMLWPSRIFSYDQGLVNIMR